MPLWLQTNVDWLLLHFINSFLLIRLLFMGPYIYWMKTTTTTMNVAKVKRIGWNSNHNVGEVGGIEIGQGHWTKVKQMAAFALSTIQCDWTGSLLDKVRVVQADTVSLIQGGFTAGSTTSEATCEAVRLSCNILVERLKPLKEKLQEEIGSIIWERLILQVATLLVC